MNRRKFAVNLFLASALGLSGSLLLPHPASAEKVLEGQVCSTRVHALTNDVKWYTDLDDAESAAAKQNKLIVWIHMVGKIDGAT